jgi:hypothetical protein
MCHLIHHQSPDMNGGSTDMQAKKIGLSLVTLALLAGCGGNGDPDTVPVAAAAAPDPAASHDPDEHAAETARVAPGFAAAIPDDDGTVRVLMTAASGLFRGGQAGTPAASDSPSARLVQRYGRGARLQQVRFDAGQLLTWKNAVTSEVMAGAAGILFVDIAEDHNLLSVGYASDLAPAQVQAIRSRLTGIGIPDDALVLTPHARTVQFQASHVGLPVRRLPQPVAAGAGIYNTTYLPTLSRCTLGMPVTLYGVTGFLTNSHCTNNLLAPDSLFEVAQFSTIDSAIRRLGAEGLDPNPKPCFVPMNGAPVLAQCRNADVAFVKAESAASLVAGRIYQVDSGTLTVTGSYRVAGSAEYPTLGQKVAKTGSTTGTTQGSISATCVAEYEYRPGISLPLVKTCNYRMNLLAGPGDSGAPVFALSADGTAATFLGLLWGGTPEAGQTNATRTVMSPLGGIRRDLGGAALRIL